MKLFEWEFNCELHLKINIELSTDINLDDMKINNNSVTCWCLYRYLCDYQSVLEKIDP